MQPVELDTPFKNILNRDNINYKSNMNYNDPNLDELKNNLKPSKIYENYGYNTFNRNNNDYINNYLQNNNLNCKN